MQLVPDLCVGRLVDEVVLFQRIRSQIIKLVHVKQVDHKLVAALHDGSDGIECSEIVTIELETVDFNERPVRSRPGARTLSD